MSSQPNVPPALSVSGDDGSRAHIRSAEEMPAGHDRELAMIFQEMRRATGVSRERIAGRLAVPVATIDILENGNLLALPDWPEASRIVTAYTTQLGLDSRPILRRMKVQLDALKPVENPPAPAQSATEIPAPVAPAIPPATSPLLKQSVKAAMPQDNAGGAPPPPVTSAPAAAPVHADVKEATIQETKPNVRSAALVRSVANWIALVGFIGALGFGLWYASQNPRAVWGTLDSLPEPIPGVMRGAWDLVRPLGDSNPRPQVFDPDNRKSDKLP